MDRFPKQNLAAFVNFLRAKYEAYTGALELASRPYYAMIDPCDVCQLECPTCPTGIENAGRGTRDQSDTTVRTDRGRMSPALFDALMDEIGDCLFLLELHSWGEPLLNQHLTAFVRRASRHDIEVGMHTNLSVKLSDERIEDLVTCGLHHICASVDGFSQKAYETFRVGGDVELAKSNMVRLARAARRLGSSIDVAYKFLVFRWNEHEVAEAERFAEEAGLLFLAQDACIPDPSWLPTHRATERPALTAGDIEELDRRWLSSGRKGYWREHERHAYWYPLGPALRWIPSERPSLGSFCAWHYSTAVVQPRGHLTPCGYTAKAEDRFGQVTLEGPRLGDVWNGARYQNARATFAAERLPGQAHPPCSHCPFPEPLRHAYSEFDVKVNNQFQHLFCEKEPLLAKAFAIIAQGETPEARASFVRFFQSAVEPSLTPAPGRPASLHDAGWAGLVEK